MLQAGNLLITLWSQYFLWLSTNIFGALFMFFIVLSLFKVFYTLGGKNK